MRNVSGLVVAVLLVAGAELVHDGGAARAAPSPAAHVPVDTLPVARMEVPQAITAAAQGEILLVDVRPSGQRALGHIRGDVPVPIDRLPEAQAKLPRDRRLVFYCSCPAEEVALDAARVLLKAGERQVAVLVGGYDAWRAANGPVQVDATWEEIFRVDQPPTGWGKTPVDSVRCRYALDDSLAARGRASARITCLPDTSARGFAGYAQRLDAGPLRGRPLTLSAMVKSQEVGRGAFLWIGAEDTQGRFMRLTKPEADPIVGTQDWRLSQVSGVVPPDAAKVLIGVSLTASGRLWLDDVRLVAPEVAGFPRVRAVVQNPSFEE